MCGNYISYGILFCNTDVKVKLRDLVNMFEKINDGAQERNAALEDTLEVADKFWDELQGLTQQLKTLSDNIANQEPPALEPAIIREQQETLEVRTMFQESSM